MVLAGNRWHVHPCDWAELSEKLFVEVWGGDSENLQWWEVSGRAAAFTAPRIMGDSRVCLSGHAGESPQGKVMTRHKAELPWLPWRGGLYGLPSGNF